MTCYLDCKAVSKPKPIKPMREAFKPVLTTTLWMDGDGLLRALGLPSATALTALRLPGASGTSLWDGGTTLTARNSPPFVMVLGTCKKYTSSIGGFWTGFKMFRIAKFYVLLTTLLMDRRAGGSVQKIRIARCVYVPLT